jgi:hypothetical protein
MPSVVEFFIFRTPEPPVTMDTSPAKRMALDVEPKLMDERETRIAAAVFNFGPDPVEILLDGQPARTLEALGRDIINGDGDLSGRSVVG